MGTFATTAIVDYRLSFANQQKRTSVFRVRLQQTNGSLPFPFSVCSKQTEVAVSVSSIFRLQQGAYRSREFFRISFYFCGTLRDRHDMDLQ
jgi:hypothetical protein